MELVKLLEKYFDVVIDAVGYCVVVDTTGVYLFTESEDSEALESQAYEILDTLALKEDEAKLVLVSSNPSIVYDAFSYEDYTTRDFKLFVCIDDLESFVRKLVSTRDVIFSDSDVDSIVDCELPR